MKKLLYIIFISVLVAACANIGSPDGGPFDEDPPKIIRTSPKYGEAGIKTNKIVLEFDEFVKIDNASENVMVSPPQLEMPLIEASGKKITIKLQDSIQPNTTYTIDFSNAIKDNNEGNEMGSYAFTFSSGEQIDTMQMSGYILDASNLEPIKGILVGAYEADSLGALADSIFKTRPFERISRTDASGHFILKGLKKANYRVYALQDQNQNFYHESKSEMVGFSGKHFFPTSKSDIMADTIWHDSIHYDSIIYKGYTHFYPDDITLTAFTSSKQDRSLVKCERPQLEMFTVIFTAGADTLPRITGINFNADSAFVVETSDKKDTINYWIRDSLIYNLDTLIFQMDFYHNDSAGLVLACDTFPLTSKISKAKISKEKQKAYEDWAKEYKKKYKADMRAKEQEEAMKEQEEAEASGDEPKKKEKKEKKAKIKDEDIVVPPMPEEFLEVKITPTALDPDNNLTFQFTQPIASIDTTKLKFFTKKDSISMPERFILEKVENSELTYKLYAEWQPDSTYFLECDTGMFVNIYGKRSEAVKRTLKVGEMDSYSTLFVILQNADSSAVVQLIDGNDKVVKTIVSEDGKADFYFIKPGRYYMRMFYDRNENGIWDTGDYDSQQQPEEMFYYPSPMELKAKWEISQTFDPTANPLAKQKPLAITKQKDSKKDKTKLSKNQQRMQEKMNNKRSNRSNSANNNNNGFDMN